MNTSQTTPKDFFLHIAATITLYTAVIAFINLSFSITNYFFPDVLAGGFYVNSIAWPLSMIIVLVPILYGIEWYIARDVTRMPEKENVWIRRWRVYLTLFLAGAVIAGDVITLLNTYLNGETSVRFFIKFLVVLVVLALVFTYYLFVHLRKSPRLQRMMAYKGIVLTIIAIILSFVAVGSPAQQRDMRLDMQRVGDLQSIQWQIVTYWQQKSKLPATLTDLNDSISGFRVPVDPINKTSYEYTAKGVLSFELCATFARVSEDTSGKGAYYSGGEFGYDTASYPIGDVSDTWDHAMGRVCFERNIDADKYKPFKPELGQ